MLHLSHHLIPHPGKTILFLHGFLGSSNQWEAIVNHFKSSYQILLVDLPGHGNSAESSSYIIDDIADGIAGILQEMGISAVHFVGHSMGGYVGCAFAKANPEQTLSLCLINSCVAADSENRIVQRNRSMNLIEKYPTAFLSMAIENLFSATERQTYKQAIDDMKMEARQLSIISIKQAIIAMRDRSSQLEFLKNASIPICYIYGTTDSIVLPDTIKNEIDLLDADSTKIESGHMSLITHPLQLIANLHFI